MVNLPKKFTIGDKVFAKVRGYPPWPARIEKIIDPNTKNARYSVYFYGTGETATCKVDELFDYLENKAKYGKTLRRKFFNEGMQQLEEELGITPASTIVKKERISADVSTNVQENLSYKADESIANESVTAASSDTESKLVIDEREPKKGLKRKSVLASQNSTPDVPEVKKRKVGRPSMSETKKQQLDVSRQLDTSRDTGIDSQDEETGKEIISRSGRKIKPKRFSDFAADISDVQKPEHTGRAKMKQKFKENENLSTIINPLPKKNTTLEKVHNSVTSPVNKLDAELTCGYVLSRTFAGEYVGIKFKPEADKTKWDWSAVRDVLKLKTQLESGEILPDQVKDKLEYTIEVTDDEKRSYGKDHFYGKCKEKWLRVQQEIMLCDKQIRSTLSLEHANPDECLESMEHLSNLPIDSLMLKMNPIIVETIRRLRGYVGNLHAWDYDEEKTIEFKKKAKQICQKAEMISDKFKSMFTVPEGQSFWKIFTDEVNLLQKLTENLSDEEKWMLMLDPSKNEEVVGKVTEIKDMDATESSHDMDTTESTHDEEESEMENTEPELGSKSTEKNSNESTAAL